MKSKLIVTVAAAIALMLAGCAKAPEAEISAANSSLEMLRAAEADTYAPDGLKMAMDTLNAANAAKTEADAKFALFRSYDKAKQLYLSADALAKTAADNARAEKERVRVEVTGMFEQATLQLAAADSALMRAPVGKGNKADIEVLKSDLAGIRSGLGAAQRDIEAERYLVARTKLTSTMERTSQIQSDIEKAAAKKK